ncbi:class IV adenylate cyclase [Archaeoglobales archaeon]|nr:MAG: adenylyl cyclase [Archaeoglobales archaeon ex4484_92]RLI82846.1 MAG: class IV adenylate cyclase [Archaeoglobales archaeon]
MEIEVKFRYKKGVEEKIREIADFVIEKLEVDLYLNHPCRNFKETDEALRIRKDIEGIKLTYKGPRIDTETKSREEIKVEVEDFDSALLLFEKLGFKEVREIKKIRKIYRMEDAIICIDEVEGLGKFLEIELTSEDILNKERLFEVAEMIGYSKSEAITESYLEMLERGR